MSTIEQSVGADVYAARIVRAINDGFTTLMMSVGQRTGLFDVMASLPPATSERIANAARLSEQYVRAWLASMAAARIVEHDPRTGTYVLPIEYAAVLTSAAGAGNLAAIARLLPALAAVEDLVVASFHDGGGLQAEAFRRVDEVRAEPLDEELIAELLTRIPGLRSRLTHGAMALGIGCGRGLALHVLARMFPATLFRGYDCPAEPVTRANEPRRRNLVFDVADLAALDDEPEEYDLILAFEPIRDESALANVARSLARDGVLAMRCPAPPGNHPFAPLLHAMHTMQHLPRMAARGDDGEKTIAESLVRAGFTSFRFERFPSDPLHGWCVAGLA